MHAPPEDDIAAITPTTMAKVGGGGLMLAGLFTLVLAAQTYSFVMFAGVMMAILPAMVSLGGASLYLGWMVTRMRGWAALSGAIVAAILCIAGLGWLVFSFMNALFSLLAVGIVPLAGLACVLAGLSIERCQKADIARERLRAEGLDSGG